VEYDKEAQPITLDFAKYGIAMYADDKDVYLPFQTVSSVYSDYAAENAKPQILTMSLAEAQMAPVFAA
jgi:hypothetical protein